MHIEQATIDDAKNILELQRLAYQSEAEIYNDYTIPPLTQNLEEIQKEFDRKIFLKALAEDQSIIGSVSAYLEQETCFIERLIVGPSHQNKGIGAALMCEIENRFSKAKRYELFTGYKSERNLYLYKKLGYQDFKRNRINDRLEIIYLEKLVNQPKQSLQEAR